MCATHVRYVQTAGGTTGHQILILSAGNDSDLDNPFAALVQQKADALLVQADPLFNARAYKIVALATRYAIPAIYQSRVFPAAGGLMSYGTDLADAYRLVGAFILAKSSRVRSQPICPFSSW